MTRIVRVSTDDGLSPQWRERLDRMDREVIGYAYPKDGSEWWAACCPLYPVGFAGLTLYPEGPLGSCAYLCRCGVIREARGQGLQRRFIRARERYARSVGHTRMVTYTSADNFVSANNLIRCGYRLYEPPSRYGLKTGLYFEKTLGD